MASSDEFVTASATTDIQFTASWTVPSTTIPSLNYITCIGMLESLDDFKKKVNDLHLIEYNKDKFRNVMICPTNPVQYYPGPDRIHTPASRTIMGKEARRR